MHNKKVPLLLGCSLISLFPAFADIETVQTQEMTQPLAIQEALAVQPEVKNDVLFKPFTGRINGNKVRMRAHSTLESAVVRETAPGEMYAIVGEEKDFYRVLPSKGTKA